MSLSYLSETWFKYNNMKTLVYEDIQPKIDIIRSNHISSHLKYIKVIIRYLHKKYTLITIYPVKPTTNKWNNWTYLNTSKGNNTWSNHNFIQEVLDFIMIRLMYTDLNK